MKIFHIVDRSVWSAAVQDGSYLPAGFAVDGFVHFSFADQVARVANARYRDVPNLVVVEFESADIPARVVVEDSYDAGEEFPHVYGPIPTAAVRAMHELTRTPSGDWAFTPGG